MCFVKPNLARVFFVIRVLWTHHLPPICSIMALPRHLQAAFTPSEIDFLAGDTPILITPHFRTPSLKLLSGTYGPFQPPLSTTVPLWLALLLRRHGKCTLVPPDWLSVDSLKRHLSMELEENKFSPLPWRYMEIAQMILEVAEEDVPSAEGIRKTLKDLREARQAKAREGLSNLDASYLQIDNLGLMELNEVRPFFTKAFNELRKLTFEEDR